MAIFNSELLVSQRVVDSVISHGCWTWLNMAIHGWFLSMKSCWMFRSYFWVYHDGSWPSRGILRETSWTIHESGCNECSVACGWLFFWTGLAQALGSHRSGNEAKTGWWFGTWILWLGNVIIPTDELIFFQVDYVISHGCWTWPFMDVFLSMKPRYLGLCPRK